MALPETPAWTLTVSSASTICLLVGHNILFFFIRPFSVRALYVTFTDRSVILETAMLRFNASVFTMDRYVWLLLEL